jgi:hypothetical protein
VGQYAADQYTASQFNTTTDCDQESTIKNSCTSVQHRSKQVSSIIKSDNGSIVCQYYTPDSEQVQQIKYTVKYKRVQV